MPFKPLDRCNLTKIAMKINCTVIMNIYEPDVSLVITPFDRTVLNMHRPKANDNFKSLGSL